MCSNKPPWHFVLPYDRHLPSGGNRYNEQLIDALRRVGQRVEEVDFAAYQEAVANGSSGTYFIDSLFTPALAAFPSSEDKSIRTIFILHHLESMDSSPGQAAQRLRETERAAFAGVDAFLVTSSFSEQYLRSRGILQPIVVVEPAVEAVVDNLPGSTDTVRGLMVANLVTRKGILPWLQALADRVNATDRFRLKIVGRTDLEPAYAHVCQRFVLEHPVLSEKVNFTGPLPHDQVLAHYSPTDIFVSAARMETFGMALQEAKAHRVPLLVLAGGYAERHVGSQTDGQTFDALPEMADFFISLVRKPAQIAHWHKQIASQPFATTYNWNDAAHQLIQQLR